MLERLETDAMVYNQQVNIISADFENLYCVQNIRKLGKEGDPSDSHRPLILEKVLPFYKKWFGLKTKQIKEDFQLSFGENIAFSCNQPLSFNAPPATSKPTQDVESTMTAPESSSSGGFVFSLDEDF